MNATEGEVRELRSWAERIRRARQAGVRGRLRVLRSAASMPRAFLSAARRALAEYGDEVVRRHGITRAAQFAAMLDYRMRWGHDPIAYYRFRLYLDDHGRHAARYLQTADVGEALKWLVRATPGYPEVFRDKRAFDRWCGAHGLPSVPSLAEFEDGAIVGGGAAVLPPADLFSKPSNWYGGRGVLRWTFDGSDAGWRDAPGLLHTREQLCGRLAGQSAATGRPILRQRLLRNHSSLAGLAGGRLCTARMLTIRPPRDRAGLLLAVYRMPVSPSFADNFDLGGIAAPIDIASGCLGAGIRKYPRVSETMEQHPDTGETFAGRVIPFWRDVVALVVRAHDAIDWNSVPAVGWDVAVLEDGPVLLEGNNIPCSTLAQMPSGVPLGGTPFVRCLNAHIRERWHTNSELGTRNSERGSRNAELGTRKVKRGPRIADRGSRIRVASPAAPAPAACR